MSQIDLVINDVDDYDYYDDYDDDDYDDDEDHDDVEEEMAMAHIKIEDLNSISQLFYSFSTI